MKNAWNAIKRTALLRRDFLANVDSIMDKAFSIWKRLYRLFCMVCNPYGESSEFCLQFEYFYRDWPNEDNRVARFTKNQMRMFDVSAKNLSYFFM